MKPVTTQPGGAMLRDLFTAAAAAALSPALAATLHVPADSPTIQGAIARARTGDKVLVESGTYHERLDFLGKAITVASRAGAATTIIDADGLGPVVTFRSGESRAAILRGFTLQHGNALHADIWDGGGVQIVGASPTIQDNTIKHNQACSGDGVAAESSSALIKSNHITDNRMGCFGGTFGGGIFIGGMGAVEVSNNLIENNPVDGYGAGIGMNGAGFPLIAHNVIRFNTANSTGGGIGTLNDSRPTVIDNVIYGNTAIAGGGLGLDVPASSTGGVWLNNTVADNVGSASGSELFVEGFAGATKMTNNIFRTTQGISSISCDKVIVTESPIFSNNDFTSTTGQIGDDRGSCPDPLASGDNLSVDPLFAGGQGPEAYQLAAGSPLIDAGVKAKQSGKKDVAGRKRVVDGDDDGKAAIDLGAYEYASH